MASTALLVLLNQTGVNASVNGDKVSSKPFSKDHIGVLTISNQSSINADIVIQHSPDGNNWFDYIDFGNKTADGTSISIPAADVQPLLGQVRASITINAGSADFAVKLAYDPNRS